jgi:hypothetical protein
MTRLPDGIDVEGPVQAEVFVVWLHDGRVELTGPCGSAPWILEVGETEHPVDVVSRIVRDVIGPPIVVHSTSWRRDRSAAISARRRHRRGARRSMERAGDPR